MATTIIDIAILDGTDGFTMTGLLNGDALGASVSGLGDINGDGLDDFIVGARYADPGGVNSAGEAYVVFGQAGGFAASFSLGDLDGADEFRSKVSIATMLSAALFPQPGISMATA